MQYRAPVLTGQPELKELLMAHATRLEQAGTARQARQMVKLKEVDAGADEPLSLVVPGDVRFEVTDEGRAALADAAELWRVGTELLIARRGDLRDATDLLEQQIANEDPVCPTCSHTVCVAESVQLQERIREHIASLETEVRYQVQLLATLSETVEEGVGDGGLFEDEDDDDELPF